MVTGERLAAGYPPVMATAAGWFRQLSGSWPDGVWAAPGRVNLIGEHTDYNGGLALPFAIDRAITVAARRRPDRRLRCWTTLSSIDPGEDAIEIDLGAIDRHSLPVWARYPVGVLWAWQRAGLDPPGLDVLIESAVPAGGGLASSAALEAAVAVAVNDVTSAGLDRRQLVELCHAAETDFVGVPVGRLDQIAVLRGRAGHGLLIDFRSLEVEEIPLTAGPLVIADTRVRRSNVAGAYAARRESCARAARELGVSELRDTTMAAVSGGLDGELLRRARHVVTENERVVEVARRLRGEPHPEIRSTTTIDGCDRGPGEGAAGDIGVLMYASHASLRDDFEVSCPELDLVVETAGELGAAGARLTGAGFGGCAIVLGCRCRPTGRATLRPGRLSPPPSAGAASIRPEVFEVGRPRRGPGRLL